MNVNIYSVDSAIPDKSGKGEKVDDEKGEEGGGRRGGRETTRRRRETRGCENGTPPTDITTHSGAAISSRLTATRDRQHRHKTTQSDEGRGTNSGESSGRRDRGTLLAEEVPVPEQSLLLLLLMRWDESVG
ncbi:unnamed protein product [Lampetra planeri]